MAPKKNVLDPSILKKFPFLAPLPMDRLARIVENAARVSLKANAVVYHQGDFSTTLYLILKGGVRLERELSQGVVIALGEISRHQVFGESALLSAEPCHESIITTCASEFLLIDRGLMLDAIRNLDPERILQVFSLLNGHIQRAYERNFRQVLSHRLMEVQAEAEKQRALTQMVAGVAHEINTPLGIINTAVSIMARELAEPREVTIQRAADIAESLELIRRNVERAHQLVQDFKQASVGQLTAEKESLDISEVVEGSINLMQVILKKNKIRVKFQDKLRAGQKTWMGYRGYLSQVLINLLSNADRYAYPNNGGGSIKVNLDMPDEDHYRIIVRDHGRGISTQNLPRIFEPFFTTGRAVGGTGLGLATVHNLVVEALRGDIRVKSKVGEGTEFKITIPKTIVD